MAGGGTQNWGGMSPYQQASQAQAGALGATQGALAGNAAANPYTYQASGYNTNRAAGPSAIYQGMSNYQNPYENQVVQNTASDIARQTQMQQDRNAAAAVQGGAFGGSRHGIVEGLTNAEGQRAIGDFSSNLRHQGFNTAAQYAGQDIANQQANRQFNSAQTNQARQFGAGARNAAKQWNANAGNTFQQNQFGNAMSGAAQLGNLGQQSFGNANNLQQQAWQQAQTGQQMQQALLGQGAGMFDRYTNSPLTALNTRNVSLGANPLTQTGTQTGGYQPGTMDYLGLGAGVLGAK